MRIDTRPRTKNSGRAAKARSYPQHRQWVRGRPCLLAGRLAHVCIGQIEAAHADAAADGGVGLKCHDKHVVPLCSGAHRQLHNLGTETWERIYGLNLVEAAKAYAIKSPHRHLWAEQA